LRLPELSATFTLLTRFRGSYLVGGRAATAIRDAAAGSNRKPARFIRAGFLVFEPIKSSVLHKSPNRNTAVQKPSYYQIERHAVVEAAALGRFTRFKSGCPEF
jgi:hypothetical protein